MFSFIGMVNVVDLGGDRLVRHDEGVLQADARVEAVEDGQRHRHVGDDRPHPLAAVKFDLKGGQLLNKNNDESCL